MHSCEHYSLATTKFNVNFTLGVYKSLLDYDKWIQYYTNFLKGGR